MTDDINSVFWCPQCGRGACSQEDGTCSVCGSDIILPQVVSAIARAAAEQEREACAVEWKLELGDCNPEHIAARMTDTRKSLKQIVRKRGADR